MLKLTFGHLSVTGNFRDNNEDAVFVDPQGRFFVVADGMGGQAAGEKASEMATQIVPRELLRRIDFGKGGLSSVGPGIDQAVGEANGEIMALSEIDPTFHNMGTTIALLVAAGGHLYFGNVGDSRIYQLRGGSFTQLSQDHSLTQALVEAGTISKADAATHRYRNVLYRYLGSKEGGTGVNAQELKPEKGDRYLLCSDGVMDGLKDPDIQALLASISHPQEAAERVVQAALDGGSKDNVSCVVVHAG